VAARAIETSIEASTDALLSPAINGHTLLYRWHTSCDYVCIYASFPNHLLASGGGDEADKFGSERSSTARGIHEV
jgi:hypothetical protein